MCIRYNVYNVMHVLFVCKHNQVHRMTNTTYIKVCPREPIEKYRLYIV